LPLTRVLYSEIRIAEISGLGMTLPAVAGFHQRMAGILKGTFRDPDISGTYLEPANWPTAM
jgi:hypothetical protein